MLDVFSPLQPAFWVGRRSNMEGPLRPAHWTDHLTPLTAHALDFKEIEPSSPRGRSL